MPLVEVQPRAEVAPGTYEAVVSNVEPDIIVPRTGRQVGQNVPVLRWSFVIEGVDDRIETITGRDPSSEKSNLFKFFVATLGTDKAKWLDAETEDLVGKEVLVTISIKPDGWPQVDNVTARPTKRQNPIPASNPQAETAVPQPIQTGMSEKLADETEEALPDELPF